MTDVMEQAARGVVDFTRGQDWFNPADHPHARVQVFGVGGIGSWVGLALAKLGMPNVDLFDFDEIEAHNIPNQAYPHEAAGVGKTEALANEMQRIGVGNYTPINAMVTEAGIASMDEPDDEARSWTYNAVGGDVVVSGFDNMEARQHLWNVVSKALFGGPRLLIDARLAGEMIVTYAVRLDDPDARTAYENTLHTDGEGLTAPCTRQSIIDVGMTVGALVTRLIRRYYGGEEVEAVTYYNVEDLSVMKGGWEMFS